MPKTILLCDQTNEIVLFEQERPAPGCLTMTKENEKLREEQCMVKFVPKHLINGPVPLN